jgi:hypothetical protein
MTSRRITASVLTLIMAACCAACTTRQPQHAPPPPHASTAPASSTAPADPAALLPVTLPSLAAAARTAARFATDWTTWNWRQPPAAWAARLRPLATTQLARQLTQAAATPIRTRQSSTGTVTAEQARLLAPGMIILTVQVRQVTTSPDGTTRAITRLAITLVPRGGGWAVYDAEPASAGDAGGVPGAAP